MSRNHHPFLAAIILFCGIILLSACKPPAQAAPTEVNQQTAATNTAIFLTNEPTLTYTETEASTETETPTNTEIAETLTELAPQSASQITTTTGVTQAAATATTLPTGTALPTATLLTRTATLLPTGTLTLPTKTMTPTVKPASPTPTNTIAPTKTPTMIPMKPISTIQLTVLPKPTIPVSGTITSLALIEEHSITHASSCDSNKVFNIFKLHLSTNGPISMVYTHTLLFNGTEVETSYPPAWNFSSALSDYIYPYNYGDLKGCGTYVFKLNITSPKVITVSQTWKVVSP